MRLGDHPAQLFVRQDLGVIGKVIATARRKTVACRIHNAGSALGDRDQDIDQVFLMNQRKPRRRERRNGVHVGTINRAEDRQHLTVALSENDARTYDTRRHNARQSGGGTFTTTFTASVVGYR